MRLLGLLGLLLLSGCMSDALAENKPRKAGPSDRTGSSVPHVGGIPLQASGTLFCALEGLGGADNDLLCFPYGAQAVVDCTSTQNVFWVQANTPDLTWSAATGITDLNGNDGRPVGGRILGGTYRSMNVDKGAFSGPDATAKRTGVCRTAAGTITGRPCRVATDCDGGVGTTETCATSPTTCAIGGVDVPCEDRINCAFLCGTSADCSWVNE